LKANIKNLFQVLNNDDSDIEENLELQYFNHVNQESGGLLRERENLINETESLTRERSQLLRANETLRIESDHLRNENERLKVEQARLENEKNRLITIVIYLNPILT
jgi:predicted nuclease with TOPRIM domain